MLLCMFLVTSAFGQSGSLRGFVTDQHGAVVPGATVTSRGPNDTVKTAITDQTGFYSISGLPPGSYSVTASAPSLVLQEPAVITLKAGVQSLNLQLSVVLPDQKITVEENAEARVSTEASNNASAQVLRGEDLDALGDNPEDLASDLLLLAGPSAGPSGGQIFIDGFSGGQLPPKLPFARFESTRTRFRPNMNGLDSVALRS